MDISRNIRWAAVEAASGHILGMVSYFILARMLGPEPFGVVAMASVFSSALSVLGGLGLQQAIIQQHTLDEDHLDGSFWLILLAGIVLFILSVLLSPSLAAVYNEPQIAEVFPWLIGAVVLNHLGTIQSAVLQKNLLFRALAIRGGISALVGCSVGILMAYENFGIWSLVGQQMSAALVSTVSLWMASPWQPRLRWCWKKMHPLVRFSVQLQAFSILVLISGQIDKFLIGYLYGAKESGIYALAYKFLEVTNNVFVNSGMKVSFPVFCKLQDDPQGLAESYYAFVSHTAFIACPVFLAIAVGSPEIIPRVFGSAWSYSATILQVLCFLGILQSVSFYTMTALLALGQTGARLFLILLHTCFNVLFIWYGQRFGIIGVAIAFVTRAWLLYPVGLIALSNYIDISYKRILVAIIEPGSQLFVGSFAYVAATQFFPANTILIVTSYVICFLPLCGSLYKYTWQRKPSFSVLSQRQ